MLGEALGLACLLSFPSVATNYYLHSVSLLPLDILQDKDLFSWHTAYLRGFKVSSANKRKTGEKEKDNKIMA